MDRQNIRIRLRAFDHRVLDHSAREIVLTIHWKGGQHSELRLRKPRSGEHDCSTPDDALGQQLTQAKNPDFAVREHDRGGHFAPSSRSASSTASTM